MLLFFFFLLCIYETHTYGNLKSFLALSIEKKEEEKASAVNLFHFYLYCNTNILGTPLPLSLIIMIYHYYPNIPVHNMWKKRKERKKIRDDRRK